MVCSTDPWKHVGLLFAGLGSLGACAICVFLHRGPVATVAGLFGFVFLGFGLVKIFWDLARPGPRVLINEDGIEDRRWKVGVIPWDEITAIDLRWMGPAKFLCVEVRDPDKYVVRMSAFRRFCVWANSLLGCPPITITFTGLTPSIEEVWEYIKTNHPPLEVEE